MAEANPDLQERLEELEKELEVRCPALQTTASVAAGCRALLSRTSLADV
jgi:hypothetical protein